MFQILPIVPLTFTEWNSQLLHWPAFVTVVVADVSVPNIHKAINQQTKCRLDYEKSFACIMICEVDIDIALQL